MRKIYGVGGFDPRPKSGASHCICAASCDNFDIGECPFAGAKGKDKFVEYAMQQRNICPRILLEMADEHWSQIQVKA